jgi:general secretion pathway protein G
MKGAAASFLDMADKLLSYFQALVEVGMKKNGFTLIELLIVVAIIGIVASIAIPNLLVALQKGKQKATMGDLKSVGTALEIYMTDNSMIPNADLVALGTDTSFIPFYIKVLPQRDGWGTLWVYEHGASPSDQYSVTSYGRDRIAFSAAEMYQVTKLTDFNNNITFSNGQFSLGPVVKK